MRWTDGVAHLGELGCSIVGSRLGEHASWLPGRRTRHRGQRIDTHRPQGPLDGPKLLADLSSRLSPVKAQTRHYGPNRPADEHDVRAAALFVRQFASPLVLISSSAPESH